MTEDLSVNEILHDPLIRQMLRADRVSLPSFAILLEDAMCRQNARAAVDARPLPRRACAPQPHRCLESAS